MGYDLYPMDTLAFKRGFIREAIEREYLIFFEHDPYIAAGYIREKREGPWHSHGWMPVDARLGPVDHAASSYRH